MAKSGPRRTNRCSEQFKATAVELTPADLRDIESAASKITIQGASHRTYGSPRVHRELARYGCRASENRVARLMRKHGIKARVATIRYSNPGMRCYYACLSNKQLEVQTCRPDQVWVGDINWPPGVEREIASSSSVMSAGTSAKSGVLR